MSFRTRFDPFADVMASYFNQDSSFEWETEHDRVSAIAHEGTIEEVLVFLGALATVRAAPISDAELEALLDRCPCDERPSTTSEVREWLSRLEAAVGAEVWKRTAHDSDRE